MRREFVGKFWLSVVLACACADPPGSGVAALGSGGGGLAANSSSGDGGVSAGSGNGGSVNIGTKAGDAAFSAAADTHYARFMLFQTAPQVPGELHARILRLGTMNAPSGSNGTGYAFSLHSYPKPVAIMLESMNDLYVSTRVAPPTEKWVCWEVEYGPGTIGWWQDGQAVSSPVPGSWPKVSLEMLEIGFETFTPVTAELWLDDVVVDTQRIGCPVMK